MAGNGHGTGAGAGGDGQDYSTWLPEPLTPGGTYAPMDEDDDQAAAAALAAATARLQVQQGGGPSAGSASQRPSGAVNPTSALAPQQHQNPPAPTPQPNAPQITAPPAPVIPAGVDPAIAVLLQQQQLQQQHYTQMLQEQMRMQNQAMLQQMQQMFMQAQNPGSTQQQPTPPPQHTAPPPVRLADVRLEKFAGNPDPAAEDILATEYCALLAWVANTCQRIRNTNLHHSLQSQCLIMHLSGAADVTFLRTFPNTATTEWTLDQCADAICSLVPDHRARFTMQAEQMHFRRSHPQTDIQRYCDYLSRGEADPNLKMFYLYFKDKLVEAVPDIFSASAAKHGLRVDFEDAQGNPRPLVDYIADARRLVSALQADQQTNRQPRTQPAPAPQHEPDREPRQKRQRGGRPRSKTPQPRPPPSTPSGSAPGENDSQLLQRLGRCMKCGIPLNGNSFSVHKE